MPKQRLTDKFVKAVKAGQTGRAEFHDTHTTGLSVRVTANGSKTWAVLYRRQSDGKLRRLTLGKYPVMSLSAARDEARDILSDVAKGGDPAGRVSAKKAEHTYRQFIDDEYIPRHAKKHKRSWAKDRAILDRDVLPEIGAMKVSEVRKRDVLKIIDRVEDRGAPIQANRVFEIIRKTFNFAIERDHIEFSPCTGIKRPTREHARERTLDRREIERLWVRLDNTHMWWRTRQVLRLCLVTGQRVGEVAGAPKGELDLDNAMWELPGRRTKNGRVHRVPLSPLAIDLFRDALEHSVESDFVFPGAHTRSRSDRAMTGHAVAKAMARNLDALELEDATPHDLRRTCASGMGELGFARLIIDKVLNHKTADRGVSAVYDRYDYEREKRQALEAWAARLQEITTGKQMPDQVVPLRR